MSDDSTEGVLLFDEQGVLYRVPTAVAAEHRLDSSELGNILERASSVNLESDAITPALRAEWEAAREEQDTSDVEGQGLGAFIVLKLALIGMRLLYVSWRNAERKRLLEEGTAAYQVGEDPQDGSGDGPFRASGPSCAGCRVPVTQRDAYYSETGNVLCRTCYNKQSVVAQAMRAADPD